MNEKGARGPGAARRARARRRGGLGEFRGGGPRRSAEWGGRWEGPASSWAPAPPGSSWAAPAAIPGPRSTV